MIASTVRAGAQLIPPTLRVLAGAGSFAYRGATPDYAYQSLIRLFCLTGGRSNDVFARLVSLIRPPYKLEAMRGVLGELGKAEETRITAALQAHGYYVFEKRLPEDVCDRLLEYALTQPSHLRPSDKEAAQGGKPRRTVYKRTAPEGIIYDFDPEDLVNHPDVQALITDQSLVAVAQSYIGARPVLDEVNLWWSTAYSSEPDGSAAQFYHFDMDRIRWLKFFIFLTDVGPENGPHCFVAGSHRTRGIPDHLLARGYARIPDADVRAAYPSERFIEFTGSRGTILAEDTRGLHKGKPLTRGDRLVLEFEFSNSLFGATPLKRSVIRSIADEERARFVREHRETYTRWLESPR
jgi:hypothetical protein